MKMDRVTYYKYAYGGIEDIRKGNFDSMQNASSLRKLKLDSLERGIVIPRFVGVYQDWRAKPDTGEERDFRREYEEDLKGIESKLDYLIKIALEMRGEQERFNPKRIHIGYDPAIYRDRKLVRELLGGGSERLGISSYENLPDFAGKETVLDQIYMEQLGDVPLDLDKEEGVSRIVKIASEGYSGLQQQLERFGLTRDEFAFLHMFNRLRHPPEKKTLDTNSPIIRFILERLKEE